MLKILKSKKGITLVELIIGMVVLAIVLAMATAILFPMMRFQARANELAEQNYILDALANQIINDLSMSTATQPIVEEGETIELRAGESLTIPIHGSVGGDVIYRITNEATAGFEAGIITREQAGETNPLLPGRFHMRWSELGVRVEGIDLISETTPNGTVYTLTIILINDAETLNFEREYTARPLALN